MHRLSRRKKKRKKSRLELASEHNAFRVCEEPANSERGKECNYVIANVTA